MIWPYAVLPLQKAGWHPPYEDFSYAKLRNVPIEGSPRRLHIVRMPNYRRMWVPGGTYFFTVNLLERRRRLLVERIEMLGRAFRVARAERPYTTVAWVILPDHLHCLWTLPEGDSDIAGRWHCVKSAFSREIPRHERLSSRRMAKGERGIWQRRYWEHLIRDERDLRNHIDYIHFNPVKHGWTQRPGDWPHSSFHRFVREGVLPADWAGSTDPLR